MFLEFISACPTHKYKVFLNLGSLSLRQEGGRIKTKPGGQKKERCKECIKVIHPIMPSDSREKQIQTDGGRRDMYSLPIAFGQLKWLPWRLMCLLTVRRAHVSSTTYEILIRSLFYSKLPHPLGRRPVEDNFRMMENLLYFLVFILVFDDLDVSAWQRKSRTGE